LLSAKKELEWTASAKARGVYKGHKASVDPAQVKQMKADGMGPSAIGKTPRIGRASVYRALTKN
jgi:DNA invertase Pin-like site-specific DNA recombinase